MRGGWALMDQSKNSLCIHDVRAIESAEAALLFPGLTSTLRRILFFNNTHSC